MGKSRRMDTAPVKSPHGFWTRFFYGVGSVAFGVKDNGFGALLLLFYNQALGLDARLAGNCSRGWRLGVARGLEI